jgi:hypothetical protein
MYKSCTCFVNRRPTHQMMDVFDYSLVFHEGPNVFSSRNRACSDEVPINRTSIAFEWRSFRVGTVRNLEASLNAAQDVRHAVRLRLLAKYIVTIA